MNLKILDRLATQTPLESALWRTLAFLEARQRPDSRGVCNVFAMNLKILDRLANLGVAFGVAKLVGDASLQNVRILDRGRLFWLSET